MLLVASISKLGVQILLVRFLLAPLEFPKLANAQPSNFGPLRMLKDLIFKLNRKVENVVRSGKMPRESKSKALLTY